MHDLLVHGHEGTHRLISRSRPLNEVFNWFTHALIGISGTAYRAFHLDHHRHLGTDRDPEETLLRFVGRGLSGWTYLGIPMLAHLWVNTYPFRFDTSRSRRRRTIMDLAGALMLHTAIAAAIGLQSYCLFVLTPIFTSLSAVVVLRSITEHHGTFAGDRWTNTRTIEFGRVIDLLWSNTTYHIEHHLFPFVPFHKLPAVHRLIAGELRTHGSPVDRGFLRTAVPLLAEPVHFKTKGDANHVAR
jgi:fatty acid desaturase